jgi:hypothetical protein
MLHQDVWCESNTHRERQVIQDNTEFDWIGLKRRLPTTIHSLVDKLSESCESNQSNLKRAVKNVVAADIGRMNRALKNITGEEIDLPPSNVSI